MKDESSHVKQPLSAVPDEPSTRAPGPSTYHLNGIVDDYDVDGEGTDLVTVLVAYANDCRKAATRYQEIAASLLAEAARADAAAKAAGP